MEEMTLRRPVARAVLERAAGTDAGEFSAPADSYMPEPQVKWSLSSIT